MASSSTGNVKFGRTRFELDPGDYPAGTLFYLRVTGIVNQDTSSRFCRLVRDSDGAVYATVTKTGNDAATDYYIEARVAFTPDASSTIYSLELEQTTVTGNVVCLYAAIDILIDGTGTMRTLFPLGGTDVTSTSSNSVTSATLFSTTSLTYVPVVEAPIFRRDDSLMAGDAVAWYLELCCGSNSSSGSDFALRRISTAGIVAASVIHVVLADGNWAIKTSSDLSGDPDWIDGEEYELVVKRVGGSALYYQGWIAIDVTNPTSIQTWRWLRKEGATADTGNYFSRCKQEYTAAEFDAAAARFESTAYESTAGNITANLNDEGAAFYGPGAAGANVVSGSALTFTGSPRQRQATAVTLVNGHVYTKNSVRTDSSALTSSGTLLEITNTEVVVSASLSDAMGLTESLVGGLIDYSEGDITDALSPAESLAGVLYSYEEGAITDAMPLTESVAGALYSFMSVDLLDAMNLTESLDAELQAHIVPGIMAIAEIWLDTIEYVGETDASHPTRRYRGRIVEFGRIRKSVPLLSGLPEVGGGSVTLADADNRYSAAFGSETPIGKTIRIKLGPPGGRESLFQTIYTGTITKARCGDKSVTVEFVDSTWEFLGDELPDLITPENFTLHDETGGFAPVILGVKDSSGLTDKGAVECPRITQKRWCAARHSIAGVDRVYVKQPSDDAFTLISSGVWTTTVETKTIGGREYTLVHVDVSPAYPANTKLRIDARGFDDATGTVLSNPAEALKAILIELADRTEADFSYQSWIDLAAAFTTLGWEIAYSLTAKTTIRSMVSQIASSFNIDFKTDKQGWIAVGRTGEVDPDRPTLDDTFENLDFSQSTPDRLVNVLEYRYNHFPEGPYSVEINRTEEDVEAIGERKDSVDLWAVADPSAAYDIAVEKGLLLSSGAYMASVGLAAPRVAEHVDLGAQVGISHYHGFDPSGELDNEPHKIVSTSLDLGRLKYDIEAVRLTRIEETQALLTGNWADNSIPGPWAGAASGLFFGVFRKGSSGVNLQTIRVLVSRDWGATWTAYETVADDDIRSFDSYMSADKRRLHIAAQTDDGDVFYWLFNAQSKTFDVEAETVSTAAVVGVSHGVSVCEATDGKVWLLYLSGETVASVDYQRVKGRYRSSGVWSSQLDVSSTGLERRAFLDRVLPGADGRAHLFYREKPGPINPGGNFIHRTWNGSTLRPALSWINYTLLTSPPSHGLGRCHVYTDTGGTQLAVCVKIYGRPYTHVFTSADDLEYVAAFGSQLPLKIMADNVVLQSESDPAGSARCPQISLGRCAGSDGETSIRGVYASQGGDNWEVYKEGGISNWTPSPSSAPREEQCGFVETVATRMQSSCSLIFRARGEVWLARFFSVNFDVGFELTRESSLPRAASYDKAAFLALAGDAQ